jgi:mRNA-degrading endonuclease RelE of RelBE toxin-antitoxin system
MSEKQLSENYQVFVTKAARRDGRKLPISNLEKFEIILALKDLKYWPENAEDFEQEKVGKALEFKFHTKDHWVRVFVYFDDERKLAWILRCYVKKTNELANVVIIAITGAVSAIEADIQKWKKDQARAVAKAALTIVEGGKNE